MLNPFRPAGELFAPPTAPFQPSSPTSRAASRRVRHRAGTIAERIIAELRKRSSWGATDFELEKTLEIPGNSLRPRRRALEVEGLVVDSGRTRATVSGCLAVIWIMTGVTQ